MVGVAPKDYIHEHVNIKPRFKNTQIHIVR